MSAQCGRPPWHGGERAPVEEFPVSWVMPGVAGVDPASRKSANFAGSRTGGCSEITGSCAPVTSLIDFPPSGRR
jgi:hypothetical protein